MSVHVQSILKRKKQKIFEFEEEDILRSLFSLPVFTNCASKANEISLSEIVGNSSSKGGTLPINIQRERGACLIVWGLRFGLIRDI